MRVEEIVSRIQPRRKVNGIAAALLPFNQNGSIAVEAFQTHLRATHAAGLGNAVNMDTGYINYLSEAEQSEILNWTREALGPTVNFVAGVYIEGLDGDVVSLYRRKIDQVVDYGATPIIFQTKRLHGKDSREKVACYSGICHGYPAVLGFELGQMFAPNGEIFDDSTIRGLIEIPELIGLKHSSLDRRMEWERLALRDELRPEFRIYTGNDLAIDMIEYGSDYLLGLATFAPEKFAERDRLWEAGDPAYYGLSDALQHLGNVAFRAPVPAYKHSAAVFLNITGRIPSDQTHPNSPARPSWEVDLMKECARRLDDVAMPLS
ncbi:MAG TPA: dihydrodipicolinate synthase family protein [Pyrinomonadaceae bacterium]